MNSPGTLAPPAAARLWPSVVILLLGISAGMQLGKVAPLIPRLQTEAGLSLTFTGWLTSLMGLFVALAAYPATRLVSRFGASAGMRLGGVVLSAGAIALALSPPSALLLAARTIEAAGYVVVVIAAPAYLATRSPQRARPALMALWGSFVPVGYALAGIQVSLLPQWWPASGVFASFVVPVGILTVLASLFVPDEPATSHAQDRAKVPPDGILLAVAFGLYVYLSIGFFTFLPRFQADHAALLLMPPSAVALFVPVGNATAALLLGILGAGRAGRLCTVAFVAAALAGALVFSSTGMSTLAMPAFALCGGLAASSLFAGVTARARDEAAATALIGAVAQAGGIATLVGPPLVGHIAATFGWAALSWSFATVGVLGAGVVAAADAWRNRDRP